ncbi:MAG: glycosyltransferase family 2 protein [Candidatus Methylomirabilales bacterium]
MRIAVIIPALDEEAAIGEVVGGVPRDLAGEIIVVDNGSVDRTAEVARAAGARVIAEPIRGYGAACLAGAMAARDADILVFLDGDRSDDPAEMPLLLRPILSGQADLVVGSRIAGSVEDGALTSHQRFGNRLVTWMIRVLYGLTLTDIGPFRAIPARVLRDLGMEHKTYGWPVEMIVKAAKKGYRVVGVPVSCRKRVGRSKVAGTLKGSLLAGYHLLSTTLRYAWRR